MQEERRTRRIRADGKLGVGSEGVVGVVGGRAMWTGTVGVDSGASKLGARTVSRVGLRRKEAPLALY